MNLDLKIVKKVCVSITFFAFVLSLSSFAQHTPDKISMRYAPLSASPSGKRIVYSPDPIVHYRWKNPRPGDDLETYILHPSSIHINGEEVATQKKEIVVKEACDVMFDFGQVNAAWFEFDSPDFDGELTMSISEFNEPAVFNYGSQHPKKTATPIRYGKTFRLELNSDLYEGVRFAWIHIHALKGKATIRAPRLVCQIKPTNYVGSFETNDSLLNRIWYTGAYTVKLNLLKDHFGAILMERSDRHSWTGDAHASQAAAMVAFGNFDFVKENIRYTALQHNGIASYSLYWVLSLIDYYNYTGDHLFVETMLDNASAKLDQAQLDYGSRPSLLFYGWDERLGAGFESPNIPETYFAYDMLCIRTWTAFARLAATLNKPEIAMRYQQLAAQKIAKIKTDKTWWKPLGVHAAAEAVNALFVEQEASDALWRQAFSNRMQRLSYSPFNQYFILQAMAHMGKLDEAITTVDDCWGGQIRYGGTTFFEVFRPSWNTISKPHDAPVNNQCGYTSLTHPWSAGVTKWLSEEILGIKPLAAGFKTFIVKPYLSSRVTRVKGETPTPNGTISFAIDGQSGAVSLFIPPGTVGHLAIPKSGRQIKHLHFASKEKLTPDTEDDRYVYFSNLPTGRYTGKITYEGSWETSTTEPFNYQHTTFKEDQVTQGKWINRYGKKGRIFFNSLSGKDSIPPASVSGIALTKTRFVRWSINNEDPRGLQAVGAPQLGGIYTNDPYACMQTMTIDIDGKANDFRKLALYFVDFERIGRRSAIEIFDLETKELLMPVHMVKNYGEGTYISFPVDRAVRIRINQVRGDNAVCSAVFFD